MVSRCLSFSASVIGVLMNPGAMQLAVTLRLAYSAPSVFIMSISPSFESVSMAWARIAGESDHGRDGDNAAETLGHHQLGRGPGEAKGRCEVDLDDLVQI